MNKKDQILVFCSLIFMGSLIVADVTSVKLLTFDLYFFELLIPAGTLAFAVTFLATDVVGEVVDRAHAVAIVWISVVLRVFILIYFVWIIGDETGDVYPGFLGVPAFWTAEMQSHFAFVFSGTVWIYIGGFAAILTASLLDVYVFHYFKRKHQDKNLFWLRNNISTVFGQAVNSIVFITIAFGQMLSLEQLFTAIGGQVVAKTLLALLDTPIAYAMKNYGQSKVGWYRVWERTFWQG